MRRLVLLLAMVFAAGCFGVRHGMLSSPDHATYGKVLRVMDGDTVVLASGAETNKVRMAEIDAPEKTQPWGPEAKEHMRALAEGKDVRVVWKSKDMYGRLVGEVFVEGLSANSNMVATGMAWQYKEYSKDPAMAELERKAREARLGLWASDKPEPPWEFRKRRKEESR